MKLWSFFEEYKELTSPEGTVRITGGNLLIKLSSNQSAVIAVSDLSLAAKIATIWNIDIPPSDFVTSIKNDRTIDLVQNKCLVFLFQTIEEFEHYSLNSSNYENLSSFLYNVSWNDEKLELTKLPLI